jgi:hypothetical protein
MLTPPHLEDAAMPDRRHALGLIASLPVLPLALPLAAHAADDAKEFDEDSILKAAVAFFGNTAEGLGKVIEKAFKEQGRPNAYIQGEEASGALTVGLRYGDGTLVMKAGTRRKVYWAGPSIGFDVGGNAAKVFTLVYKLPQAQALFRRFPAVEGSFYYVGGAGINYQRVDGITLAPIRLGVGLRSGVNMGYVHYRAEKSLNPF